MKNRIRVTTDVSNEICDEFRNARPNLDGLLPSILSRSINIEIETLKQDISKVYSDILKIVDELPEPSKPYSLDSISFTITIDSEGKASLLSTVSTGFKSQTGITFTVSKK
jgi:hypothetical protein